MAPARTRDVLVVDDDAAIRKLMVTRLARLGLSSDGATDGADALVKVRGSRYDVILVDLMMPRVDGAEFVTRLAEDELASGERPIVLMMTASTELEALAPTAGRIQAVIAKPFDVIELGELVRDCVDLRHRELENDGRARPPRATSELETRPPC